MNIITNEELRKLVKSYQSSDVADIYAKVLKPNYIRHEENLYKINHENQTLKLCDPARINGILINEISIILRESEKVLNSDQLLILNSRDFMGYRNLSKPSSINSVMQLIDVRLNQNVCDGLPHEIHFKNGYIDTKTLEFKQRKTPVLNFIDRDYIPSTEESKKYIHDILNKIYPQREEREYILNTLGSAFSGAVKKDRTSLFLLGRSSAGKSILMQTLQTGFSDIYVREFSSNTFSKTNANRNKIMNQFLRSPQVRITWVNELQGKIDDSLFKSFCEGSVVTTQLYKDGTEVVPHHSKVVLTSNEMPNIKIDTGITSRIVSYQHISHFTDNKHEVDPKKYIYQKDKDLLNKLNNDIYKNAIVDIILGFTQQWFKHGLCELPASMQNAKNDIVNSNDCVQDFIDKCLEKDENGRIGKQEMLDAYLTMFPKKKMSIQTMITAMKDKQIEYKCDLRFNGVKGCYIGFSFCDEDKIKAVNYVGCTEKEKQAYEKEIEQLKKQIAELQKKQQQPIPEIDKLLETPQEFKIIVKDKPEKQNVKKEKQKTIPPEVEKTNKKQNVKKEKIKKVVKEEDDEIELSETIRFEKPTHNMFIKNEKPKKIKPKKRLIDLDDETKKIDDMFMNCLNEL